MYLLFGVFQAVLGILFLIGITVINITRLLADLMFGIFLSPYKIYTTEISYIKVLRA